MLPDVPKPPGFFSRFFKLWRLDTAIEWQRDSMAKNLEYQKLQHDFEKLKKMLEDENTDHQYMREARDELRERERATHRYNLDAVERLNQLELRAEQLGMTLPTHQQYVLAWQQSYIKQAEMEKEKDVLVDKERQLAQIETRKQLKLEAIKVLVQKRLNQLEIDKTNKELQLQFNYALAYRYINESAAVKLLDQLSQLHQRKKDIYLIEGKTPSVIAEELKDLNIVIAGLRRQLDRLIQAPEQGDFPAGDEATLLREYDSETLDSGPKQIPDTDTGRAGREGDNH